MRWPFRDFFFKGCVLFRVVVLLSAGDDLVSDETDQTTDASMEVTSKVRDTPPPFSFGDGSIEDGCQCRNDSRDAEVTCRCRGEIVTDIPANLSEGVAQLILISASFEILRKGALQVYASTLRDLYLDSLKKLKVIEPGAFSDLTHLRSVYIRQAINLKSIPSGVFEGNLPNLKIIRIIQSGLEVIPNLSKLNTSGIISMIDLDSNRIRNLTKFSVNEVKAEIMNLDYNMITTVQNLAFHGSEIAKLSLKGNRPLVNIEEDAFRGLKNLRKLDLSQTSIRKLPTTGLDELEVLKITDTFTLKVFPSVYRFKHIQEAYLTYPYHCCAFRFPSVHDPVEYARQKVLKENVEKRYCTDITTTPFGPETPMTSDIEYSFQDQKATETTYGQVILAPLQEFFGYPRSERRIRASYQDGMDDLYGSVVYTPPSASNNSQSWGAFAEVFESAASSVPQTGFGKVNAQGSNGGGRTSGFDMGTFHSTTASPSRGPITVYCGNFSRNYRDVKCYPEPDAFNPCEDVMGNVALRTAVWFVVVAAMLGNLAVMIVLMSGRFTMSVSKFLMCNLAFADFCMGSYLLIIAAVDVHTIGVYFNYAIDWQHGVGCKVAGFLTVFASELSIFTLTVITLERWYAITYAIHLNKRLKLGMAAKVMVFGWLYAITMATLPLLGISGYSRTSICLPMENQDASDLAYLLTLLIINGLAFVLICACYGKMYFSITRQQSSATANDMTVAKRMAMLVFTDFACWAPIAFFGLTAVSGYPLISVTNSKILLVFFYPLNSCANPFLYAIFTKQYRRDLFILLSRYGFCTKRAMKYKGTYSCNTIHRGASMKYIHQGSTFSQVSYDSDPRRIRSVNSIALDDASRSVCSSSADVYPAESEMGPDAHGRLNTDLYRESRRLSIVCENSVPSSDEESSSPMHKGSPHPVKNSYTKLNVPNLEQEEILKKVLSDEKEDSGNKEGDSEAEMFLWCSQSSSAFPIENSGFASSSNSAADTEM